MHGRIRTEVRQYGDSFSAGMPLLVFCVAVAVSFEAIYFYWFLYKAGESGAVNFTYAKKMCEAVKYPGVHAG